MRERPGTRRQVSKRPVQGAKEFRSLRSEHRQVTKRRILEAAHECFTEYGYAETSIEEVAARAGVSRTTLYQHVTNKRDIMELLFAREASYYIAVFGEDLGIKGVNRGTILTIVNGMVDFTITHAPFLRAIKQAAALEEEISAVLAKYFIELVDLVFEKVLQSRDVPGNYRESLRVKTMISIMASDEIVMKLPERIWDLNRETVVSVLTELWCDVFNVSDCVQVE